MNTAPQVLDGRKASHDLLAKLKSGVDELKASNRRVPGLKVIQVGQNPASEAYIRQKCKAASEAGLHYVHARLPRESSYEEILAEIKRTADDATIDGMILQLPLDSSRDFSTAQVQELIELIPPRKDADGLHSFNQGKLFTGDSTPLKWAHPIPATPFGIFRLLEFYGVALHGRDVAVVGKSRLVGFPAAVIAAHAGATVTICNRHTKDLAAKIKECDIVIIAAGQKHLVGPAHLKTGAVVVDVGIHVKEDGKLTGDVAPAAYPQCAAYSPVPGGVGPMTVACLMENTYRLRLRNGE